MKKHAEFGRWNVSGFATTMSMFEPVISFQLCQGPNGHHSSPRIAGSSQK